MRKYDKRKSNQEELYRSASSFSRLSTRSRVALSVIVGVPDRAAVLLPSPLLLLLSVLDADRVPGVGDVLGVAELEVEEVRESGIVAARVKEIAETRSASSAYNVDTQYSLSITRYMSRKNDWKSVSTGSPSVPMRRSILRCARVNATCLSSRSLANALASSRSVNYIAFIHSTSIHPFIREPLGSVHGV
jgi:hypothetical protein